jgi:hypothetical protein
MTYAERYAVRAGPCGRAAYGMRTPDGKPLKLYARRGVLARHWTIRFDRTAWLAERAETPDRRIAGFHYQSALARQSKPRV